MPEITAGDGGAARLAGDGKGNDTPLASEGGGVASSSTSTALPPGSAGTWSPRKAQRSTKRWWIAVLVGIVISLPFAWLLSYAALLPFFIGLFFFVLFGLLIGAVAYRIAAPARPFRPSAIIAGTTLIVAAGWGGSIIKESRDFPSDVSAEATRRARDIGESPVSQFRAKVADQVREFLRERYPPGGIIGYVRWILTSGELKKGDIAAVDVNMSRAQNGWLWVVRVALSIAALTFGVASQTWLLKAPLESDPASRRSACV